MRVKFGLVLCPVYSQASQGLYCSRVDGKSLHQQRQGPRHGDARFVAVAGGRAPVSLTTAVVPLGTPRPRQTSEAWVSAVRAFLLLVPVRGGGASSRLTVPPSRDIGADASLGPLQKGPLSTLVP